MATTGFFVDHAHVSSSHATLLHAGRIAMRIRCDVGGGDAAAAAAAVPMITVQTRYAREIDSRHRLPSSHGEREKRGGEEYCLDNYKYFQNRLLPWIFPNYSRLKATFRSPRAAVTAVTAELAAIDALRVRTLSRYQRSSQHEEN